mgnify:CR=1 FL=1
MGEDSHIVDGFVFSSLAEAQTASKEQKNIEIIRQRTPLQDPKAAYSLYCKLIERNMFKTNVGYGFLYELRHYLVEDCGYSEDDLPTVAVLSNGSGDIFADIKRESLENKIQGLKLSIRRMTIVIIALVAIIVGMFVVAVINPNVGYVNTERKVLNKYSAWEEDLQSREEAVKQREKELNIEYPGGFKHNKHKGFMDALIAKVAMRYG